MTITELELLYARHIKPLPTAERLRLLGLLAQDLAAQPPPADTPAAGGERNIMELHGLGREIWNGVDAQEYVNALRDE